jgi:WD40 repeat protein
VSEPITNAAFLSTQMLALANDSKTQIWDFKAGKLIKTLVTAGHKGTFAVSPDKKLVAIGTDIYQLSPWKKVSRLETNNKGYFRSVAFSPDSRRVVSGAYDTFTGIEVYDVRSGRRKWIARGDLSSNLVWSSQGEVIASSNMGELVVIRASDGKVLRKLNNDYSGEVWFLPDGENLVAVSDDKLVIYATSSGKVIKQMPLGGNFHNTVSPDGKTLAQVSRNGLYVQFKPLRIKS